MIEDLIKKLDFNYDIPVVLPSGKKLDSEQVQARLERILVETISRLVSEDLLDEKALIEICNEVLKDEYKSRKVLRYPYFSNSSIFSLFASACLKIKDRELAHRMVEEYGFRDFSLLKLFSAELGGVVDAIALIELHNKAWQEMILNGLENQIPCFFESLFCNKTLEENFIRSVYESLRLSSSDISNSTSIKPESSTGKAFYMKKKLLEYKWTKIMWLNLLQNENTPEDIITEVFDDLEKELGTIKIHDWKYITKNRNLPKDIQKKAIKKVDTEIRCHLAMNKEMDVDVRKVLMSTKNKVIAQLLLANQKLTTEEFLKMHKNFKKIHPDFTKHICSLMDSKAKAMVSL